MNPEERVNDIRIRLRADFIKTLREHLGRHAFVSGPMLDGLCDDAMSHIEQLVLEASARWYTEEHS